MLYRLLPHRLLPLLLVAALAAVPVQSQQQEPPPPPFVVAPPPRGEVPPPPAPEHDRLRRHVRQLSSEKLDGRRTGTEGARLAALHVAGEFQSLKLRPAGGGAGKLSGVAKELADYLQPFPYVAAVELGKRNSMSLRASQAARGADAAAALDLRAGEDWTPLAWSASASAERLPVTYAGYGVAAAELNHDDYAGADVRGRAVLVSDGTPDGDNPHGRFGRHGDLRFKAAAARERGARALVVVTRSENFKGDRLTRLRPDEGLAAGDAGLPVVLVSRQVARRAVAAAALPGVTFEQLERQAATKTQATPLANVALDIETDVARREAPAFNVVGVLEGSDPKLKEEAVVVGAHYDHLGRGGRGSLAAREGEVHHGADDNASGTAALLELARVLSTASERPRRTIVFAAFGGEEEGLLGSNFYVNKSPAVAVAQTVAMLNMDMIGRMKDDRLIVGGVGTAAEWKQLVEALNGPFRLDVTADGRRPATNGVPMVTDIKGQTVVSGEQRRPFALVLNEDGFGPSDHSSFYARQVPVLFLWTGTHEDYHKPTDTADRINYDGLLRVTTFALDLVRSVASAQSRPTYAQARTTATAGRSTGFRVYLGTIPSYAEGGEGLKLDGVRDDSPAAAAGLRAGDVIVRMAGRDVKNVYDYTYALGEMKAGEEYEVEVLRGGERLKMKLTPAARR